MTTARLSVIVTTHHRPGLLRRALESILRLGPEVQIVLCADECSAATRAVASECLRDHDIFVAAPGLRGPSETRNLGLQLATGDYISFLDDDDTIEANVLSLFPTFDDIHVVYTDYRKIFEIEQGDVRSEGRRADRTTSSLPISAIMVRNFIFVGAHFSPRRITRELRFRSDLSSSEDWEFLISLYKAAPFKHVEIISANWHIVESATSRNKVSKSVRVENAKLIYRTHPSRDESMKRRRVGRLRELGATEFDDVL